MKKASKLIRLTVIILILMFITIYYSMYVEPSNITIKEINVINEDLPKSFYGYKIAHISDIHYNNTIFKKDLKKIFNTINKSKPNIIVITGDLLDKKIKYTDKDKNDLVELLNSLKSEYKYIITGDHDKSNLFKEIINKTDFKLLDNSYEIIYNGDYDPILISGLSTSSDNINIANKLNGTDSIIKQYKITYNIMLMHEPSLSEEINTDNYQLLLAGHTHNGQINIPFIKKVLLPKNSKAYTKSYYKLNDCDLYISNGIGTTNYKARLFNKPTVYLYRLLDK